MSRMWIDGRPVEGSAAALSILDHAIMRGDGCFEAMRSYGGRLFAMTDHLDRLERSAAALRLALPVRGDLERWVTEAAAAGGDAVVRLIATRGHPVESSARPRTLIYAEEVPELPPTLTLYPVVAPWHPAGAEWSLAGVKSISYAPNMAAGRDAHEHGFDDALLLSREGLVLEGPTFSVAWVSEGAIETPSLELGILESITRRHVLALAEQLDLGVTTGRFPLSRLLAADEIMALSTVKEVMPVTRVGGHHVDTGEITARLREEFASRTRVQVSG